jgi:hypothetical protein
LFWWFCGRLCDFVEVLFMLLFPGFLLRRRFVASSDVALYLTALSGMA